MAMLLSPDLPPLPEDARPLAERVHAVLRDAIVAGVLAPGGRLSERGLAAALGVSAQPVREAMQRLEAEGLVETRPRSGSVVLCQPRARLVEMGRIRAALEGVAAGFAAEHATPEDIDRLRQRLAAMRTATEARDGAALRLANEAFHTALLAVSDNAFLLRGLQALRAYDHIGRARVLAADDDQPRLALAEHAAILEAVAAGDAPQAEALMRRHALRSLAVAFPGALPEPETETGAVAAAG
ncbi:GntR family transcriptional regulator [Pseudoroseomonas cervicalis]|uniref:GntR family transcriptional regulator n=1 Tax=Teichococcus cervicalis TaxID=204525 RepID=UPI002785ED9C|nr:GntR family transcriptional regulator [Pseudoroseomonas cervicalis]MDQ1077814.1 DNA-binding GntR family transcriptional regulator [Pseudoroseomonas cervicalis]